jgi:hypothetical protein
VIASAAIRDSYNHFGNAISFDITFNLLRNITHNNHCFRVGILTVGDTNQRILFAGLVIIVDETTATFFTVFDTFLNIYTQSLMSIITDDQLTIVLAIDQLRANKFLMGAHMPDS